MRKVKKVLTQKCDYCNEEKPLSMFNHAFFKGIRYVVDPRHTDRIIGLFSEYQGFDNPIMTYLRPQCKECDKLYRERPDQYIKKCLECGKSKPLTEYHKQDVRIIRKYNEYSNVCLACEKDKFEHPEKYVLECFKCGQTKPLTEFYWNKYSRSHTGPCKACDKAYRLAHKKQIRKRDQRYRATLRGKEVTKAASNKRRTYPSRIYMVYLIKKAMKDGLYKTCPHCNTLLDNDRQQAGFISPKAATLGHIRPLSRGGLNYESNIIIECLSCNLAHGTKTYAELYPYTTTLDYQEKLAAIMH